MLSKWFRFTVENGKDLKLGLLPPDSAAWLAGAAALIDLLSSMAGRSRAELEAQLAELINTSTRRKVVGGLAELLLERCRFSSYRGLVPGQVRSRAFELGASAFPVGVLPGSAERETILSALALEFGVSPGEIPEAMFADLPERDLLQSFQAPAPSELLAAYNLALLQTALKHCRQLSLEPAGAEWTDPDAVEALLGLADLCFAVTRRQDGARVFVVEGPLSKRRSRACTKRLFLLLPELLGAEPMLIRASVRPAGKRSWLNLETTTELYRTAGAQWGFPRMDSGEVP